MTNYSCRYKCNNAPGAVFFGIFRCFGESVKCEPMKSVAPQPHAQSAAASKRSDRETWKHPSFDWSIIKFVAASRTLGVTGSERDA